MVNSFLEMQIKNMIVTSQGFEQACQIAAMQDDGLISKAEEKALRKVRAAAAAFCRSCKSSKSKHRFFFSAANTKNTTLIGWYFCFHFIFTVLCYILTCRHIPFPHPHG